MANTNTNTVMISNVILNAINFGGFKNENSNQMEYKISLQLDSFIEQIKKQSIDFKDHTSILSEKIKAIQQHDGDTITFTMIKKFVAVDDKNNKINSTSNLVTKGTKLSDVVLMLAKNPNIDKDYIAAAAVRLADGTELIERGFDATSFFGDIHDSQSDISPIDESKLPF